MIPLSPGVGLQTPNFKISTSVAQNAIPGNAPPGPTILYNTVDFDSLNGADVLNNRYVFPAAGLWLIWGNLNFNPAGLGGAGSIQYLVNLNGIGFASGTSAYTLLGGTNANAPLFPNLFRFVQGDRLSASIFTINAGGGTFSMTFASLDGIQIGS